MSWFQMCLVIIVRNPFWYGVQLQRQNKKCKENKRERTVKRKSVGYTLIQQKNQSRRKYGVLSRISIHTA